MVVLDMLDSDESAFGNSAPVSASLTEEEKKDDFDYWGNPEVKPESINLDSFSEEKDKSYVISYYSKSGIIPDEIKQEFVKIAKALNGKGYKYRHTGGSNDEIDNTILAIENINTESYLPWKTFNKEITKPVIKKPTGKSYRIAANSHKAFKKLTNGVRAILARNIHAMLGKELNKPATFIIAYSEDGAEAITRGIDFKVTGNVAFFLKVAEDSNIPVFNIKKKDAITRLVEYIQKDKEE